MTGDNRLASLVESPNSSDAWAIAFGRASVPKSHFQPTIGASYLKENLDRFLRALGDEDDLSLGKVIWLRPSGSTWRRTAKVAEVMSQIRQVLKNKDNRDFESLLYMPRSTSQLDRTSHRTIFDNGLLMPRGHFPANIEILLVPGKVALVNAHILAG